ncbi:hypothetical protein SISNIDRAFT_552554 [Sistotremastrum niveocremeum HHB9708]|uniref:Protein kinase domain-containing protein n=1 Tax=Sistotremastrum niveocremeum HHB9708 TaxID=1314777 RepID=A0A164P8N4_9AGAM|nr:hypothetical protein SISNIDRAFT_552554 [Sistotremastrum niveocremeum HHB9708]
MSRDVLRYHRRAARKDPDAVRIPFNHLDEKTYNSPRGSAKPSSNKSNNPETQKESIWEYVEEVPEIRNLEIGKLSCLDLDYSEFVAGSSTSMDSDMGMDVDMGEREQNPGKASVFRAEARWEDSDGIVQNKVVVLKVVPAHDTDDRYAQDLFITESACYARLTKAGLCKKGYIPSCYGSYHFPPSWNTSPELSTLVAHPRMTPLIRSSTSNETEKEPPRALLIEYLDAEPVSPWNISEEIAKDALKRLRKIHRVGILHSDVFPRNLLISRSGPVWIDFGVSCVRPDDRVRRDTLFDEFDTARSILFEYMMPDHKRALRGEKIRYPELYAPCARRPPKRIHEPGASLKESNVLSDCSIPRAEDLEEEKEIEKWRTRWRESEFCRAKRSVM